MALIPPFFLDCVIAIGFPDDQGNVNYLATGFLYGRLVSDASEAAEKQYRVYLITNKHVFQNQTQALVRFNPSADEPARVYGLNLTDDEGRRLWTAHPEADVDIVAQSLNVRLLRDHGIRFAYFQDDQHVLLRDRAIEAGLSEGDGIYVLGFPMGEVGKERNYVVVRQGAIARIRDSLAGAATDFLIDAFIFPGSSGGPVVTRPEAIAITGTKSISAAYLIGVVSEYVPYQDVAISQQTRRPRIVFEENSGLAAVVPVDRIAEVVSTAEEGREQQPPVSAAG